MSAQIPLSHRDRMASKREKKIWKVSINSWITIQKSHAIANGTYIVAVNRVGTEKKGRRKFNFGETQ